MPDTTTTVPPPARKRSRVGEIVGILIIISVLVLAAFFQESLAAFFSLKLWDKGAPAHVVEQFLEAGKKGDKAGAQAQLGAKLQELNRDGQWKGYFLVSQAGVMEFEFSDLAPSGAVKASGTEFITIGKGAAEVMVPDSKGKDVKYRLEMVDGSWKITEILGGHPQAKPAGTPPPKSNAPAPTPPGSKK